MYTFDSRIRYSEVGPNKKLDLASIINYFQDCSTFHSEDIGLGLKELEQLQRAWIINSWQIVINRYPELGERVVTGTWAYGFKSMYGLRNFIMKTEDGEVLAYANSIWVLMDTEAMRPTRITTIDIDKYVIEDAYEMEYAPRKIKLPDTWDYFDSFKIIQSNIDTNNHVNNGQYIKMAEEYLPDGFKIHQMRAEYQRSAVLDDVITPKRNVTDKLCTVVLANSEDKPYAIIEFTRQ
ncbi:acyl-acyl carrier protein thioesterase [Lachnospiraceae bacterium KM106-2]|nr:acyl-acyl carrier protein thioesterase [Lachnospiraceae bacterium KM106-2]